MFNSFRFVRGFLATLAIIVLHATALVTVTLAVESTSTLTPDQQSQLDEARDYHAVAVTLNDKGLASDAIMAAERALAVRKRILGDSHRDTADSLSNLGLYCRENADYVSAGKYLEQALAINKKERGPEDPATATVLERLGVLLELQARVPAAVEYTEQALNIRKKSLGENHPSTAISLSNLGDLLRLQGDFVASRPLLEQALKICKKNLGEEHRDTANAFSSLGDYYWVYGDLTSARPFYERAIAIRKKVLGDQHPETATSMHRSAMLLSADGEHESARALMNQGLKIKREMRGVNHPETGYLVSAMGHTYVNQQDFKTAIQYYEQALPIFKKTLGDEHHDTAGLFLNLGNAYYQSNDFDNARRYLDQAVKILKKTWGLDHPDTASAMTCMGNLLYSQGDFPNAHSHYEQASKSFTKVFGETHDQAAGGFFCMGIISRAEKNYADAQKYYDQSLTIYKANHGEEHPSSVMLLNELGNTMFEKADYPAARTYFEQTLKIRKKLFGDQHADTLETLAALEQVKLKLQNQVAPPPGTDTPLPVTPKADPPKTDPPGMSEPTSNITVRPPESANPSSVNSSSKSTPANKALITPEEIARLTPQQVAKLQEIAPLLEPTMALYQKGQYRDFLPAAKKLSIALQEVFGPKHKLTAMAVALQGMAYNTLGELDAAQPLLEQALALELQIGGERNLQVADILFELTDLKAARGDLTKSREYAERCLAIRKELLGEKHMDTAMAIYGLGNVALKSADFDLARTYMERSLTLQKNAVVQNDPAPHKTIGNLARTTINLALIQQLSGDVLGARKNYEEVLEIRRKVFGEQHPDTAASYLTLGVLQLSLGDYPLGQKYYEKALEVYLASVGEKHPSTTATLMGLGDICLKQKNIPDARKHLERVLAIRKETLGEKHSDYAATLLSLGKLHQETGDYATAREFFDRASAIIQQSFGKDNLANIAPAQNISQLLQWQGDFVAARPFAENAIRLIRASTAKDSFELPVAIGNLSEVLAAMNAWDDAAREMDQARRMVRKFAADVLPGLSERELLLCLRNADDEFWHSALSLGYARSEDQAIVDFSAAWLLNGKGIAQESLSRQQAIKLAKKESRSVKDLPSSGEWVELKAVRDALPADTLLVDIVRLPIRNFQAKSRDEQWSPARYLAWVVPPSGNVPVRIVDLGDAESLDSLVGEFRKVMKESIDQGSQKGSITELGDVEATELINKPLKAISLRLLAPIGNQLAGIKNLVISPDASLWLIPWAGLPLENDKYLIEEHSLQLMVSGRDVARPDLSTAKLSQPIIMADPGFDLNNQQVQTATKAVLRTEYQPILLSSSRSASLAGELSRVGRLPNTALEAQAIAPNIEQLTKNKPLVYLGEFALEGVFKKATRPKLLVVSTHGVFLPPKKSQAASSESLISINKATESNLAGPTENPLLRCGLLLAGCNQRPLSQTDDDGILTGEEIVATNLRGTELVVLSACETAVGEVRNGDGVAGLRQAFQLAGAKSVVATLWMIDDRESALFMRDFFENLASNEEPAVAMRNAQLKRIEFRRDRKGAAHPFYWAAWTVTGG